MSQHTYRLTTLRPNGEEADLTEWAAGQLAQAKAALAKWEPTPETPAAILESVTDKYRGGRLCYRSIKLMDGKGCPDALAQFKPVTF